jgi:hypothetical protein
MTIIACLSMVRPNDRPRSYWGDDGTESGASLLQNLVVVVSTIEESVDGAIAYGVDPATGGLVFVQLVPIAQLGMFFKYVADGETSSDPAAVDIPVPQPRPIGPKLRSVIDYALRFGAPVAPGEPPVPSAAPTQGGYGAQGAHAGPCCSHVRGTSASSGTLPAHGATGSPPSGGRAESFRAANGATGTSVRTR